MLGQSGGSNAYYSTINKCSGAEDTPQQVTLYEVLYDIVNERNTGAEYDEIKLEEKNQKITCAVYDEVKGEEISERNACPAYEEVKDSMPVYSQINKKRIKEDTACDNNDEDTDETSPTYSQVNKIKSKGETTSSPPSPPPEPVYSQVNKIKSKGETTSSPPPPPPEPVYSQVNKNRKEREIEESPAKLTDATELGNDEDGCALASTADNTTNQTAKESTTSEKIT